MSENFKTVFIRAPGVVGTQRLFSTCTATLFYVVIASPVLAGELVGQRPKRPVPGGQRRVVSRLGVLDLLFGILKFPLQVRPWPERIGNSLPICRPSASR